MIQWQYVSGESSLTLATPTRPKFIGRYTVYFIAIFVIILHSALVLISEIWLSMGLLISGVFSKELDMLFYPNEKGQGFMEYGMLLVLIAVIVILVLTILGRATGNLFSNAISNI